MSEKQYRLLNVGDTIQLGDEWLVGRPDRWLPVSASIGDKVEKPLYGAYRRPIEPADSTPDLRRQLNDCQIMLAAARASEKSLLESNEKLSAEVGRLREENDKAIDGCKKAISVVDRLHDENSDLRAKALAAPLPIDLDAYAAAYTAAHQPAEASPRERIVSTIACGLIASGGNFNAKDVVRMADELIKEMSK